MASGGARFLVVAIDYFTKWVKAKPLVSTMGRHMEKFVWEHIVCRFGIPQIIISDNQKQFAEGIFPIFCQKLGILQCFTLVYHPQENRQVEVHRTTLKSSNGETPFSLVYGSEAVIPIEISMETKRINEFKVRQNEKRCRQELDILKERREIAFIREAITSTRWKDTTTNVYDHLHFSQVIVNGDLVSPVASASIGAEGPIPPKTAKQKLARKNELKAKSTLMLAIPDEHLLKFHACKDEKSLWEAIKNRFGGNKESKKMQKTILKQNYENFPALSQEGLDKTYVGSIFLNETLIYCQLCGI
ncbi:ribonuclease H-like domain-containing protein [Tanacetum coccineum]